VKHDHDRTLELAATALDWRLTPVEATELNAAIRTCASCRGAASTLASTNGGLSPVSVEPPRHVDVAVRRSVLLGRRRFSGAALLLAGVLATVALLGGAMGVAAPSVQTVRNGPPVVPALASATPRPESARQGSDEPRGSNRLDVGGVAVWSGPGRVALRTEPGHDQGSTTEAGVQPGQRVAVAAGPEVLGGVDWYLVTLGTTRGWLPASDAVGQSRLRAVRNGVVSVVDPGTSSVVSVDRSGGVSWRVDAAGVTDAAWSRDGRFLALAVPGSVTGRAAIRLVGTTGEDVGVVAEDVAVEPWLDWGAGLLAAVTDEGGGSILVVSPVDPSLRYVAGAGSSPSWSPVAGRLAFLSSREGGRYGLSVMRADGANPTTLVDGGLPLQRPAWSPDGSRLAILAGDGASRCRICLIVARSGEVVPLTTEFGGTPTWSPDGRSVAFVASGGALHGQLLVAGLDGVSREVSIPGTDIRQPEWSPDGRYLAFTALVDGRRQLGIVQPDGSDLQWLWVGLDELGSVSWQPTADPAAAQSPGA
jgi:hypothetical protein